MCHKGWQTVSYSLWRRRRVSPVLAKSELMLPLGALQLWPARLFALGPMYSSPDGACSRAFPLPDVPAPLLPALAPEACQDCIRGSAHAVRISYALTSACCDAEAL